MIAVTRGQHAARPGRGGLHAGRSDRSLVRRVLIPGAAPEIAETLRMVLGWAWTYVIVAELIGASSGIGHMITDSQALLATDQIIFGIIVIGLIGLVSDFVVQGAQPAAVSLGATGAMMQHPSRARRRAPLRQATHWRCRRPTSTWPRTTSSPSSARAAAARARCCASSPGSISQTAGEVMLDGQRIDRPRRRPRHGVPELHAVPVADGARQRLLRPARTRPAARASSWRSRTASSPRSACGLREPLPEAAVGRHAAARRDRARAGQRPAHAADGRALRRARPPDARADAGAAARHLGSASARPCSSSPTTSTRRSSWPAAWW